MLEGFETVTPLLTSMEENLKKASHLRYGDPESRTQRSQLLMKIKNDFVSAAPRVTEMVDELQRLKLVFTFEEHKE